MYCPNCKINSSEDITTCSSQVPLAESLEEAKLKNMTSAKAAQSEADMDADVTELPNLQAHSDIYVSNKDKYENLSSSGSSLLIVGAFFAVVFVIDLSRIVKLPITDNSRVLTDTVLGVIAFACLWGAHSTYKKANLAKAMVAAEQRQRQQIINWCVSTYSALQIDKMIEAAEASLPDSMEILSLKRMDMIKSYLIREYHIDDEPYLEDLSEDIFQKIFETF